VGTEHIPIFLYAPDIDDYARFDRNFAYPIDRLPYLIACDNESLLNNVFTFNNDAYVKKIRAHHLEAGSYENANSSEIIARLINSLAKYKGE